MELKFLLVRAKGTRELNENLIESDLSRSDSSPHGCDPKIANQDFTVVGVGASSGGLEAFSNFLRPLDVDTGLAFVLVQHLSPKQPSHLVDILSRTTKMSVLEATDGVFAQPNTVYILPPGNELSIPGGKLKLSPRDSSRIPHHPIDHFFSSLAEEFGHRAIGVVLSGTANDGTLGLLEIKAAGGITFAQDESAKENGMPSSAIDCGSVDFILSPSKIAEQIVQIAKDPYLKTVKLEEIEGADSPEHKLILSLVRKGSGVDFSEYKSSTIIRRIKRRMVLHKIAAVRDYGVFLQENSNEATLLYQDLLINVTSFFRDPEMFILLQQKLLPKLFENLPEEAPLRVWVLGCSTGEEAYSLAIAITEYAEKFLKGRETVFQIFATDLSESAITRARAGRYPDSIAQHVSVSRLERFFTKVSGQYEIKKSLRQACVFANHNMLVDPPFSRLDLISCRNLLIYLGTDAQQKSIPRFHYALKPKGVLVLGGAETIGTFTDRFEVEDSKHKIYSKKLGSNFSSVRLEPLNPSLRDRSTRFVRKNTPKQENPEVFDINKAADKLILGKYAPARVVINSSFEIQRFHGDTSRYLVPAAGKPSHNILSMARDSLLFALRSAIQQAKSSNTAIVKKSVEVKSENGSSRVDIEITPINSKTAEEGLLVAFKESLPSTESDIVTSKQTSSLDNESLVQENIKHKEELSSVREYLQSIIEDQDSLNEELQSAIEEAQSANEELQSINEELETSKEEIQSSNEELTTVNEELSNRNAEVTHLNNDLLNLIEGIPVAIVIVGLDFRIRRSSPMAERLFNIFPSDAGRLITDIKTKIDLGDLESQLNNVIKQSVTNEREVQTSQGRWHSLRISPYLTTEKVIDGVLLMMLDVDAIRNAREYAENIIGTIQEPLLVLDSDLCVRTCNDSFKNTLGSSSENIEGNLLANIGNGVWNKSALLQNLREIFTSDFELNKYQFEYVDQEGHVKNIVINARRMLQGSEQAPLILMAFNDITERTQAELLLHRINSSFETLIQSAPVGIFLIDHEMRIRHLNTIAHKLFSAVGDPLGSDFNRVMRTLWADEVVEELSLRFQHTLETGEPYIVEEYAEVRKGKQSVEYYDWQINRIVLPDGNFGVVCYFRDTSAQMLIREGLAAADNAKSDFMAVLAHELLSPLNAILGWSRLIQRPEVSSENLLRGLQAIDRSSKTQASLISDLLDIHRISSGKMRIELCKMDIRASIEAAIESVLPAAAEKNIKIDSAFDSEHMRMTGDALRLQQVFRNILVNAIKFTPREGHIRVGLISENSRAKISICDTGEGVSSEVLQQLFEPFRQADQSSSRIHTGLGLGLSIAKQFVELHNGAISVESAGKGLGTTFFISLPLVDEETLSKPKALVKSAHIEPIISLKGLMILIVDDEVDAREPLRQMLEDAGAEVVAVGSARESLKTLRVQRPDLLISDIGMAGQDGYDLIRSVRKLRPENGGTIPAIALTAYSTRKDRKKAFEAGFQLHFAKPVEPNDLITAIVVLVGKIEAPRESLPT